MRGGEVYLTPSLSLSLNSGSSVPQSEQLGVAMLKEDLHVGLDWIRFRVRVSQIAKHIAFLGD